MKQKIRKNMDLRAKNNRHPIVPNLHIGPETEEF